MRARSYPLALSVVVVALAMSGCSSGPDTTPSGSAAAASSSAKAGASDSLESDASGWFAGNRVTLTGSRFDSSTREITVSASVENTANTDSLDDHFLESITLKAGDGAPLRLSDQELGVVASATSKVDFVFEDAPAGSLEKAVLQLGGTGERRWMLPLAPGATATGLAPATIPASGVADADGMAFTVDRAEVLPWECWDSDDLGPSSSGRVYYKPVAEKKLGLVLWGDITESRSIVGGDTLKTAGLVQPDGSTVAEIGTVNSVFDVNDGVTDFALCFTIDSPAGGDYTLNWTSYRGATANLVVTVPGSVG